MTSQTISSHTIRVLLVEDSPTEAMLIQASLSDVEEVTFEIQHTTSLADTQAALSQQHYDIVVLDLTLPDCSGIETFIRLRESCPGTPVVILTANTSKKTALETVKLGAQDYILKEQIENMQLQMSLRYAIERKKSEEALKQARAEVEKAYHELKETQAQLVQNEKLASIGQLAAGVAHEMNTPLGFIASNIETLKSYVTKLTDVQKAVDGLINQIDQADIEIIQTKAAELKSLRTQLKIDFVLVDAQDLVGESQEGLDTLAKVVQSLRDFTRIDQAESHSEYDLNHAWESTLLMAQSELHDIRVNTDLGDIPLIYCNPTQINEVFLSVTRNAIEALQSQTATKPATLSIQTVLDGERIICRIQDNGPGIAADVIPHIFDPFFTTKPVGAGQGLGLSIAHDIIVKKHQGQLNVESKPGQGTIFTIALPLEQQAAADPTGSKERENHESC